MVIQLLPERSSAQYRLPKIEVLVAEGIKTVHLSKRALRPENEIKKTISQDSIDHTPLRLATYSINSKGRIDSIHFHPNDTEYSKKDLFRYSPAGHLYELKTITASGKFESRTLVEKTPENQWYFRQCDQGQLSLERSITADSITYLTIRHRMQEPHHFYMTESCDLKKDIKRETYYQNQEVLTDRSYR